ncbi:MAG: PAS domain S-box protein [bacterium]|nr:PAS domain S-box protein [bacterium]
MAKTRSKLEEELVKFSHAVEQSPGIILITDPGGNIQYVNNKFCRLTGYTREEVSGKKPNILRVTSFESKKYEEIWKIITSGSEWKGEFCNKKKNGDIFWEKATISPIKDEHGTIMHFVKLAEDITEKKRIQEELNVYHEHLEDLVSARTLELEIANQKLKTEMEERRRAMEKTRLQEQQLIQADKMVALGTLVAGVAHEINNPNNFIMMNTPLLQEIWTEIEPILEEHYRKNNDFSIHGLDYQKLCKSVGTLLAGSLEGAGRIKDIVKELKDFARRKKDEIDSWLDINNVVHSAVTLTAAMIKKSTDNFSIHYDKNIPKIMGKFQRLEQVVINLIQNSCQALDRKEKALTVTTGYDKQAENVTIKVTDEGIGIPGCLQSQVFDPFFTTKRDNGGSGLGLSISSTIINAHGGTITFESNPGTGSSVTIILPVKPEKVIGQERPERRFGDRRAGDRRFGENGCLPERRETDSNAGNRDMAAKYIRL